jgi:hypothetical protein
MGTCATVCAAHTAPRASAMCACYRMVYQGADCLRLYTQGAFMLTASARWKALLSIWRSATMCFTIPGMTLQHKRPRDARVLLCCANAARPTAAALHAGPSRCAEVCHAVCGVLAQVWLPYLPCMQARAPMR